jgi:NAD(P)-dependent dehydrogenase (short-subunit alcohol dehydrogenase family)
MSDWNNRTVLVTGSASGIGRATALRFAREGASVALLDRNAAGLERTAKEIGDPARALALPADLQDEAAAVAAVDRAAAWKGRLDAVVNVAGISPPEEFLQAPRAYWDAMVQINLRGTYVVAQAGARHLVKGGGGAIVNVSSVLALVGDPSLVVYSATKGGISAMTRAMAVHLAKHKVRVNAVCPGDVATPLLEDWIAKQPDPAATKATIASAYPLGHYCDPEDVAGAILFLAGPDARCVTGANLVVDCGLTVTCY